MKRYLKINNELKYYIDNLEDSYEIFKKKYNKENENDVYERIEELRKQLNTLNSKIKDIHIPENERYRKSIKIFAEFDGKIETIKKLYKELNNKIIEFDKETIKSEKLKIEIYKTIFCMRKNVTMLKDEFYNICLIRRKVK